MIPMLCIALLFISFPLWAASVETPTLTIQDQVEAEISPLLFGSMLERASFGEPGPEGALTPGTRTLRPEIVTALAAMPVPILRFPGGTDVDSMDWRDLISGVGDRGDRRPNSIGHTNQSISNEFGLDEFLAYAQDRKAQTLLCVKVLTAITGKETVASVAQQAARLVAYCNAPINAQLLEDLGEWPQLRAKNGHPEPWQVPYFQIGNEVWMEVEGRLKHPDGTYPSDLAVRYRDAVLAVARAMLAVDPGIRLITDGPRNHQEQVLGFLAKDPDIRKCITFLSDHTYGPGPVDRWTPPTGFTDADHWRTWVAMPGRFDDQGMNVARKPQYDVAQELGYQVAATEWNWNGWGHNRLQPAPKFDVLQAAGIGAAGFIHGLMRQSHRVPLATQSLILGGTWDLASVHYDPKHQTDPCYHPSGIVLALLAQHHGPQRISCTATDIPTYAQPHAITWSESATAVAALDVMATGDATHLFIHVINRSQHDDSTLKLLLPKTWKLHSTGTRFMWQASLDPNPPKITSLAQAISQTPLAADQNQLDIPPRCVCVFQFGLSK